MAEITQHLEIYTKEYLLNLALTEVPDDLDKRQGSIIYDTLAIVCAKMADVFVEVIQNIEQGYIKSATRDMAIEYRVAERGIERQEETYAERLGIFTYPSGTPATVPLGSMFSTIEENKENVVNFQVISPYMVDGKEIAGSYVLQCQTAGTVGNTYFGEILPLSSLDTLGSATISTVITPARNREENDSLKERYFATFNIEAFGGNIADYRQYMQQFAGVGQTQIYPRTQENEQIVLSCVDTSNQPISIDYQNTIKQTLDPENYYNNGNDTSGMGLGVVPIGHKVSVMAPDNFPINVDLTVILANTAYLETVIQNIRTNIQAYIKRVQDIWDDGDGEYETIIYYNQVLVAASSAEGVVNIDSLTINGQEQNIVLTQNRTEQHFPVLGTLTVSEA